MKKVIKPIIAITVLGISLFVGFTFTLASSDKEALKSNKVTFFGSPSSSISSSVSIPHNYNRLFYSGTVPPLLNPDGNTTYERYGDTEIQAIGILENFETDLEAKGLSV